MPGFSGVTDLERSFSTKKRASFLNLSRYSPASLSRMRANRSLNCNSSTSSRSCRAIQRGSFAQLSPVLKGTSVVDPRLWPLCRRSSAVLTALSPRLFKPAQACSAAHAPSVGTSKIKLSCPGQMQRALPHLSRRRSATSLCEIWLEASNIRALVALRKGVRKDFKL